MEEKGEVEEEMLPGFRFHPTDEELVGFYLRRKIQHRTLSIELIKQVDIYKYDPWDLPKLATTGEKEWYFYCPRDRKYRNSARPNRVTGAGFWKATGTDRPIYSSEGSKCIGLKKSLVFYRGRAAKGIKTDWMMHEFRLPPLPDRSPSPPHPPPKKLLLDKTLPPNETWAICRIFKKTNSMAQRALSHPWMSSPMLPPADNSSHIFNHNPSQLGSSLVFQQQPMFPFPACATNNNFIFPPIGSSIPPKTTLISDPTTSESLEFSGFSIRNLQHSLESSADQGDDLRKNNNINQWDGIGNGNGMRSSSIGFPFSLPTDDDVWDTVVHPAGDMSSNAACYSTNKCYT